VRDYDVAASIWRGSRPACRRRRSPCEWRCYSRPSRQCTAAALPLEHGLGGSAVVHLAARQFKARRTAQRVGEHMDLGGQSASGASQSLALGPLADRDTAPNGSPQVRSARYARSRHRILNSNHKYIRVHGFVLGGSPGFSRG
jgi:hypothetical protein